MKPKKSPLSDKVTFADNQEYRFAWVGFDEQHDRIVPVDDAPIYVRTKPFSFVIS